MGNASSSHKISAQDRYVTLPIWRPHTSNLNVLSAILDMKNQRDKLHQYQKRVKVLTDRETAIARECLARGQKPKALLALRRKKHQESLLQKTDLQLEQLQRLTEDVTFAAVQKDVLYGIQQGTAVLKQIHAEIGGIDQVERLLEDNAEARAYEKEINEALGGMMSNEDEDEVEDELATMEREVVNEGRSVALPNAPQSDIQDTEEIRVQKAKARTKQRERERRARELLEA